MIALLLDHLWQSSIFAGGAGLLTLTLRRNSASARFWLWFAASAKFLVPFAILASLGTYVLTPITPPLSVAPLMVMAPVAQPFSGPKPVLSMTNLTPPAAAPIAPVTTHLDLSSILLALWALGFLAISVRWMVRWWRLRLLLRDAASSPFVAPIAVKFAGGRLEPGLVGIFRPVILLPKGIEQQLSLAELNAIVAHELCHWRRRDNLLAAFHMLVEALFWFFPLVWWLGARLNAERERACDESVLAAGNDPKTYAEGILKVCRIYLQSPLACAAGVSGAGLKKRMELIMENRFAVRLNVFKKSLLAISAAMVVAAPLALGLMASPLLLAPATAQSTSIDVATAPTPDGAVTPDDAVAIFRDRHYMPPIALKNPPLGKAIPLPPAQLDKFSGYYELSPSHKIRLQHNGAYLFITPTPLRGIAPAALAGNEWFPKSPTNFFSNVPMKMRFDSDAQGRVTQLVFYGNGWEQAYKRIDEATAKAMNAALATPLAFGLPTAPPVLAQVTPQAIQTPEETAELRAEQSAPRKIVSVDPKHFDKFVGYYQLGPSSVASVHRDGAHLLTKVTGQTDVEVFPESETKFFTTSIPVPAQWSFNTDAQGRVTESVLHQGGYERHMPRIDEVVAKKIETALALRIKNNTPSPGTQAALRHHIETEEKGQEDYSQLGPVLAAAVKSQAAVEQQLISGLGPLKSITFKSVGPGGADSYDVVFERGDTMWNVSPLSPDGKISGIGWRRLP